MFNCHLYWVPASNNRPTHLRFHLKWMLLHSDTNALTCCTWLPLLMVKILLLVYTFFPFNYTVFVNEIMRPQNIFFDIIWYYTSCIRIVVNIQYFVANSSRHLITNHILSVLATWHQFFCLKRLPSCCYYCIYSLYFVIICSLQYSQPISGQSELATELLVYRNVVNAYLAALTVWFHVH